MTTKTISRWSNRLIGIALFTFHLSLFTSCDDYLDNVPKGEKIPTTLEDFSALMGDEYNNSREAVSQAIYLLGDQYVSSSTLSYDRLTRANYLWDTSIDRIKENNSDEMAYYVSYGAISTANLILENIDAMTECSDQDRRTLAAQAKVLRAMKYFTLVNYYSKTYNPSTADTDGGVPLITSAEVGAAYTQPSVKAIYDFILHDLTEALPDLPETAQNILYADRATGYAFAARVYLQMGNYSEALSYARQALDYNDQLFDWPAYYEENIDVLADPDNYQQIQSPMDYWFVENYNFCHGSSIYQSNDAQITVHRATRFEEGDAAFLSRWKLRTIGADTFYEHCLAGLYNRGGMTTTEVWLIEAECLARTGSVSEAMAVLNQVRRSRILPDVYADLEATTEVEAVRQIIETKANALIVTLVPFCDARRLNLDSQYARTLTKVIDGQTLTLAPDSYLWTMAMPQGAQKNSAGGTVTQNVER